MPHSFLQENTVYLIIMAIAHIVYKWLIKTFSKHIEGLEPQSKTQKVYLSIREHRSEGCQKW